MKMDELGTRLEIIPFDWVVTHEGGSIRAQLLNVGTDTLIAEITEVPEARIGYEVFLYKKDNVSNVSADNLEEAVGFVEEYFGMSSCLAIIKVKKGT